VPVDGDGFGVRSESRRDSTKASLDRRGGAPRPRLVQLSLDVLLAPIESSVHHDRPGADAWPALRLPSGRWTPAPALYRTDLSLLVVSGALLRHAPLDTEVLLPGDLSRPGFATVERWRVLSDAPALVGVLNATTVAALAAIPGVAHALLLAVRNQHERGLQLRTIASRYDVRERIVRFFSHLASRVGRPEGDGIRIALALEQRRIEEIVGAGHTQASTSFRALLDDGVLVRDAQGWRFFEARWSPARVMRRSSVPNGLRGAGSSVPNSIAGMDPRALAISRGES
jgi:hypothetical protein